MTHSVTQIIPTSSKRIMTSCLQTGKNMKVVMA